MKLIFSITLVFFSLSSFAFDASVVKMNGKCLIDGKEITLGAKVKEGQKLTTEGKGSFAVIQYENGTRFILKEGSLQLKKLNKEQSLIGLFKGTFLSFVNGKDKKKKQKSFRVLTRHTALGVRGTKFWTQVSKEETYLCVCEGEVMVKRDDQKMSVKRGEDIHVNKNNKLTLASANDDMWNMAVDGFKLMDIEVQPRK